MSGSADNTTFSAAISASEAATLEALIRTTGFESRSIPYARFSARGEGVVCTLYESGRCVIQGPGLGQFLQNHLPERAAAREEAATTLEFDRVVLGSDEAGKGDYFGPLVVAACAFGPEHLSLLEEARIVDSKTLSAKAIAATAALIRERLPHAVVQIGPARYNELYPKFRNLNRMLAWAHGKALDELLQKQESDTIIVDKFCEEDVLRRQFSERVRACRLILRTRAESNPAVAAASILASDAFTRALARLGREIDLSLPKGAGAPVTAAGRRLIAVKGREVLGQVAKLHFVTTEKLG